MSAQRNSNLTFKRLVVLAALFFLSMILYLDRAAISSAKTSVATALSLSDAAIGAVFSAFALGYAFAQIPSGWLADRFGPRVTLAFVVALWSVFTVLTGVASGLATLLVVRFLFWRRRGRRAPDRLASFTTGCRHECTVSRTAYYFLARWWEEPLHFRFSNGS